MVLYDPPRSPLKMPVDGIAGVEDSGDADGLAFFLGGGFISVPKKAGRAARSFNAPSESTWRGLTRIRLI